MINRYSPPDMAALFSDVARFKKWLQVELFAVEGFGEIGVIPKDDVIAIQKAVPQIDQAFVEEVNEREKTTDHDVAAFVDVVQSKIGMPLGSWVHYGMTSSDVVDTALSSTIVEAADLLLIAIKEAVSALARKARAYIDAPVVGRTHGMHAEPTTFGAKFALFALQLDRDRERLLRARQIMAVGKLSGAVGTFSNVPPEVEDYVCRSLSLTPVPATQVIARDRHAEYLYACASIGSSIEAVATEIRHMARTELGEAEEAFGAGQKGSSAMPHKRNPILSERLCGIARILRSYVGAGLEDVALWHERDISHSSVERVVIPDASMLTCYSLRKLTTLIDSLVIHEERALDQVMNGSFGLVFSQSVLLSLIDAGLSRDSAYRIVQRDARAAWEKKLALREVLETDSEVTLGSGDLDRIFDVERVLAHRHRFIEAIKDLD